jgi:acyl-CoA hydrolase
MHQLADVEAAVDAVIAKVGNRLRLAVPLAIGKPNHLINAFYRRAKRDPQLSLHIYTALTLQRPRGQSELERRFLEPFAERVWGDHPDLDYELDRTSDGLPGNVHVSEFYLYAGKLLGNAGAQRDYISTNYSHVARDLLARGVNVVAQQVCRGQVDGRTMLSLSCNPDVAPDLLRGLRAQGAQHVVVGQVNAQLPFMYGDALVAEDAFDFLIDDPAQHYRLFATPKTAVTEAEYLIGLYASTLVRDGGSLQIGIGAIGDALVYALKLRHSRNRAYLRVLDALRIRERFGDVIAKVGGTEPFTRGLFAPTEMLVDGFRHLIEAGIVKREVYDDVALQELVNGGRINAEVTPDTIGALIEAGAIRPVLDPASLGYLQRWGVLLPGVSLDGDALCLLDGTRVGRDLGAPAAREALRGRGLGVRLEHGKIVHAGFFLGPESFYEWLRSLPDAQRRRLDMRTVTRVNQLYGHEALARAQRQDSRFVNTAMMATLLGAVVSDGLDSGKVVSGVGGQYNFVAMAHELEGARSVLQVRASRIVGGEQVSNVVYDYGHVTIPRYLRDLLVTEHGIADLRGKTDEEVVQATLAISDDCAQSELQERAVHEGKLDPGWRLPELHRHNVLSQRELALRAFRAQGLFPPFPFGTELTDQEVELSRALRALKDRMGSLGGEIGALTSAATTGGADEDVQSLLERMGLGDPQGVQETLYARLLAAELRRQRQIATESA